MSRNGSGIYSLAAGNPVVTGTTVSSTWANSTLTDIASALTTSIASDGQTVISANIPMNSKKLTGLAAPTLAGDALSFGAVATISTLTATTVNSALNGSLGATTPSTVAATTITSNGATTLAGGNTTIKASYQILLENAAGNDTYAAYNAGSTGTSTYSFRYAGVDRMTLDASGNLGVGETSPNSQLTIKKSASGALGPNIILNNSGGGFSDQTALTFQSSGTTRGQILSNVDGGAGGSGSLQFWTLSNNGATFSEKMRVDSSGNLLVGTTTSPTNVRAGNKYQSLGGATIEGGPVANISISTSAVQLTRSSGTGGFAMITGYNTGNGDQGTWFVSWSSSRGATIISAQLPVGIVLTFTVTSGALFAATVSGTFLATIFAMSA